MIKCLECNKEYKRIPSSHFRLHNMTKELYMIKYPDAITVDPETIKKYSNSTSNYFNTLSIDERKSRTYVRTEETKTKLRNSLNEYYKNNTEVVKARYTAERSDKIRHAQLARWSKVSVESRSEIFKKLQLTIKNQIGEAAFNEIRRKNGSKALSKFKSKDNIACASSFEKEMYDILSDANIKYIPQFEIKGWFYDCYLPEKNLILEFDGDFWHPKDLSDCKYEFQYKRLHTDKFKTNVAIRAGYDILRIRESEKFKIQDII